MTKLSYKTLIAVPVLFVACSLGLPQCAQADTLQLTGLETGFSMGGVYTSPYKILVNPLNGAETLVMACDDFTTDISIGTTWQATKLSLSDVADGGPQKFQQAPVSIPDSTTGAIVVHNEYTIQQEYNAAAWLVYQLLTNSTILASPALAGEYSFAIWQIFYPQAVDGWGGNPLTLAQKEAVGSLLTTAFANSDTATPGIYLYTPSPIGASQEFIGLGPVPEASAVAFLFFNLLALGGAVAFVRRRVGRAS